MKFKLTNYIRFLEFMPYTVTYTGFLQTITRTFPTKQRAEQWAQQVGVFDKAIIVPTNNENPQNNL